MNFTASLLDPTPPRKVRLAVPQGTDDEFIAAEIIDGSGPTIVFLSGFQATMTGTKASWLAEQCAIWSWGFIRFDYRGRGQSGGERKTGTLTSHLEDVTTVIEQLTDKPVIIVGSSMGGWLGLRYAAQHPERVAAFVGIAAAPDFTTYLRPQYYDDVPNVFIDDAANHLMLNAAIPITCPVHLLQGMEDSEVPQAQALKLVEKLESQQVTLHLVKDGDHSLSRPQDLALLWQCLSQLRATAAD